MGKKSLKDILSGVSWVLFVAGSAIAANAGWRFGNALFEKDTSNKEEA